MFTSCISTWIIQRGPKLSFKLYSIQLPVIKARSAIVCFNKIPSYLSSYVRFNCQLSRQDLHLYVLTRTQSIFQALFDSIANYQGLKLRLFTQPGPALNATQGHKHPIDIRLTLRLVHKPYLNLYFNKDPNYLSNYRFNFQLYVTTRTQAIFQAIFDSMLNKLAKIYACMFQQEPKLTFKHNLLVIRKCKSQILINSRYSIA